MAKTLDIKKLAKGMSLPDKAKMLFADINKRAESEGVESLLTPYEKEAIIEDAVKNNQIKELKGLKNLYDLGMFLIFDIQTAFLNFKLAIATLSAVFVAIAIKTANDNIMGQIICDLAVSKETDEEKADKLFNELDKKYRDNQLLNQYDLFTPPLFNPDDYLKNNPKTLPEPNILLQGVFMETVNRLKAYKFVRHQLECIVKDLMGIDFLSDRQKRKLKEHDKVIADFVSLEGVFAIIKVFGDFADKKIIRTINLTEPKFLEAIKDINKTTELMEEDKKRTEEQINHLLLFKG